MVQHALVLVERELIYLVRLTHRVAQADIGVADIVAGHIVILSVGCQLAYLARRYSAGIDTLRSVPNGVEDDGAVVEPVVRIHIRVYPLAEECLFSCDGVGYKEAVLVALVSITLHAEPCNILSVRRVGRIGVVAFVLFCQVGVGLCKQVV